MKMRNKWFYINALQLVENTVTNNIALLGNGSQGCNVYPNPAKEYVTIEVADHSELKILDMMGKVIQYQSFRGWKKTKFN